MKILLLISLLCFTLVAKDLERVSIQLQWLDQFQFAGYYVAKERGFYEDAGLDVEIKKYSYGVDVLKDIQEKKTTYGVGYTSLIKDKSNGANIKILYATFQSSPLIVLATKESNITTVAEFSGKRLMTNEMLNSSVSLNIMIRKFNIALDDMTIQEHSFNVGDLLNNNTDLMISYISNEPYILNSIGAEVKIFDPKEYGFDFYSDMLFTSDYEMAINKKRAMAFKKASLKGWKYAFDNIEETVELILKNYNVQNKSKNALLYEAKELKKLAYYKSKKLGTINEYKIQRTFDAYNLMGLIDKKINFNTFIVDLEKQKKIIIIDYALIYQIISVFLLILIILYFRYHLLEKANKEVEKQKKLYDLISENASNGVLIIDAQSLTYIDANRYSALSLGYDSIESLVGLGVGELSPEYQEDGVLSSIKSRDLIMDSKEHSYKEFEWIFMKKDGTLLHTEIYATVIELDEKPLIHMLWRDINRKKAMLKEIVSTKEQLHTLNLSLEHKVEEAIKKNQLQDRQLIEQSRLAQMGEMLSMIAHQWRQPLNSISLTSNNLSFKCAMDDIDIEFFKTELALIGEYSQHLSSTIDDFRNFFKKNRVKERTNLNNLVSSVLKIVQISIENKNIKVINKTDSSIDFESYPNEIKQVIMNIIKNAEDVLLEKKIPNPTITIQTENVNRDLDSLIIKDNAGGIDDGTMDEIFNPYYSTKKAKEGTGLGLYMSKTIIEEHCNGLLSVHNDKDGAVFTITINEELSDKEELEI